MIPRITFFIALILGVGSCSVIHPTVPIYGEAASLEPIDGRWEGFYSSDDSGRSGGIYFDLAASPDSAVGEVVMVSATRYASRGAGADERGRFSAPDSEVLRISFVRAESGMISGRLNPYTDPECGCTLETTFVGDLDGDHIEGTFVSFSREHDHTNRGTWEVSRQHP